MTALKYKFSKELVFIMTSESSESLKFILNTAKEAAVKGEKVLRKYFGNLATVEKKELAGLVTEADLKSEKEIVAVIKKAFPHHEILGEEASFIEHKKEFNPSAKGSHRWVIDPLDGTTNYVHSFPIFCISIGYEVSGETLLGLVSVPMLNQVFWAIKGKGAFLNDELVKVSERYTIAEALLATGFFSENKLALKEQLELFNYFVGEARGVRRSGSAAFDLCMVASGIFDVFWEKNLSPWDTSAGALIVQEAGGRVTNYENKNFSPYFDSILAANPKLHELIQPKIETLLKNKKI